MSCIASCLFVLVAVGTAASATYSQDVGPPEWQAVKSAIERRRSRSMLVEYEVQVAVTMPENYFSETMPEDDLSETVVPVDRAVKDVSYAESLVFRVDFQDGRFRMEDEGKWHTEDGLKDGFSVSLYRNGESMILRPDYLVSGRGAALWRQDSGQFVLNWIATHRPLFWSHGIFTAADFLKGEITDLSAPGHHWSTVSGQFVLERTTTGNFHEKFVFDPSLDCQVTEFTRDLRSDASDSNEPLRFVAHYQAKEKETCLTGWDFSTGACQKAYTVTRTAFPASFPAEEFEVPSGYFQTGAIVSDNRELKVVAQSGALVPWKPGDPLPDVNRSRWWTVGSLLAITLIVSAVFWWRRSTV